MFRQILYRFVESSTGLKTPGDQLMIDFAHDGGLFD
jgi:hypothetical protein